MTQYRRWGDEETDYNGLFLSSKNTDREWGEDMPEFYGGGELDAINQYGVSEALIGFFNDLREMSGPEGTKFRQDEISRLERAIVFRNYGKCCLELAHLIAAVLQLPQRRGQSSLLNFFWIEMNMTPQRARAAFQSIENRDKNNISVGEQFIEMRWGKESFAISPSRIGFLAALMEFAQEAEPQLIVEAEKKLASPTNKSIHDFSSWIQKKIYEYLDQHMIPAQLRRRFRHLIDWYKTNNPTKQTMEWFITDDSVFYFWQKHAKDDEGLGFRRFRTVGDDFYAILKALDIGRNRGQSARASTIGTDVESGEWHPDQLTQACENLSMEMTDLNFLAKRLKFFPKAIWVDLCQEYINKGNVSLALPLTLVRMEVLGGLQAKLIQADKDDEADRFEHYMHSEPEEDYDTHLKWLEQFQTEISQAKLLGLGLFLEMNSNEALSLISELLDKNALHEMQSAFQSVERDFTSDRFMQILPNLRLEFPKLNQLCQQAISTFNKTTRAGFKELPPASALPEYRYGLELIDESRRLRDAHVKWLKDIDTIDFNADLTTFRSTLKSIYGAKS